MTICILTRAGRIKQVIDESGTELRYYGKLGETTREQKTVLAHTPSQQQKTYTTDYVFDSFGRMQEMTYPDGELLRYAYDNGGLLKAAWGEKSGNRYNYINSLLYDEFGQRTHIEYGNSTTSNYTYDPLTRRLATLVTTLNASQGSRQVQNLSYQYDLVGNVKVLANGILVATNTALPAGPVRQQFDYDDLYQLTGAKGAYGFGPGKENNYTNTISYDTIGNMTIKNQVNQIIQPSTTVTLPKETNYVLNYVYGSSHPHAVTDAGDKLYSYDANGNMTGWTSKTNGTKRTIIWNEENRVKEIDDNGKATYFLYDDSGERVVKRGQYGETIYINRFYSVKNGELGTKSIFAGETRVLSKLVKTPNTVISNTTGTTPGTNGLNNGVGKKLGIIKRLPLNGTTSGVNPPIEKDEFFYHGDHLGSSNMITDSYGAVYQHLEYFPYGETWIDEGGSHGGNLPGYKFTGKELDPETGLYYYGARYYDAVLSKWISADPMLSSVLSDDNTFGELPRKLSLYAYSRLNPIIFRDPDGKDYEVLVGGSYKGHPYGHVALRVFGDGYDTTYDFGRYAGETSMGQGPGALRVWDKSFSNYIAGEKATGRTTEGYAFKTSKEEDMAAMAHFSAQIEGADKSKTISDKRGFKQYIRKDNYHAVNKNCTTVCIGGVKAGKSDLAGKLADPKESKGRGLNWLEKKMSGEVGNKIFMPEDLKSNIEKSGGYYKQNEYKSGQEVSQ